MTRGPLTSSPPVDSLFAQARRNDPVTSKLAAAKMNRSGKAAANAAIVLDVVASLPGRTYREIAQHCPGIETTDVMKRLCDLEDRGLVRKSGARVCSVNGTKMTTWRAM